MFSWVLKVRPCLASPFNSRPIPCPERDFTPDDPRSVDRNWCYWLGLVFPEEIPTCVYTFCVQRACLDHHPYVHEEVHTHTYTFMFTHLLPHEISTDVY